MPGAIQVSVLDFKDVHSSSPSSQISVKVAMGKREYQTWDRGEFSFPLTTLRDNLIITLQDAKGNDISHTGVETRLVVEKGVWDDMFSLEGGGYVHMKLQFVLSEEERQRIRIMRESAVKKKHDELCNSGHGSPKSASIGYNEVPGSEESFSRSGLLANEASIVSVPFAEFDIDNRNRSYSILKQKNTNDRDENEGNTSAKSMLEASNVRLTELSHQDSVPSEPQKSNNSKKRVLAGKAESNVRKMISAFEGSLNQDVKPSIKPPPQTEKIGMDFLLANSHLNEVETEKITPSKVTLGRINTNEFEQTKISIREKVQTTYGAASSKETEQLKESTAANVQIERKVLDLKNRFRQTENDEREEKKYSKDFRRTLAIEQAAFSRRMLDKHSKDNQSWNLSSKKQHFSRSLVTKDGSEEIFEKDLQEAQRTSNEKLKSMAVWRDDHCSTGSSGLWIFPGESKCLCITTGSKQISDIMGGFCDETNTHQRKFSACQPKIQERLILMLAPVLRQIKMGRFLKS
ncbi:hypothetical protein DITRI_Ditri03aG0054200 [Diplodiscus trichospermus]